MGTIVARKYELLGALGAGGLGAVFEAKHIALGRRVAIKHLHRQFRDDADLVTRFLREAQAAAAIEHEAIVAVLDVDEDESLGPIVVLELLHGDPLDALIARGALPPARAIRWMVQVLDGVAAAHAHGVIHRDLKPSNLFVVRDAGTEQVKVLDFGIARIEARPALTGTGEFIGTPVYASPEHRADAQSADAQSDVFSLGVTLFEMVTAAKPSLVAIPALRDDAMDKRNVPPPLAEVIVRATAIDRAVRYASATAMRDALLEVLSSVGEDAVPAVGDAAPARPIAPEATLRAAVPMAPDATRRDAPVPTIARATTVNAHAGRPWPRIVAAATALAIAGVALATGLHHVHSRAPATAVHRVSDVASVVATPQVHRHELARVCRAWSGALLAAQEPDGQIRGEPHRAASGWDTAQSLAGLLALDAQCDAVDAAPETRARHALIAARAPWGWSLAPTGDPTWSAEEPATAWATIALGMNARNDDAADARDDVVTGRSLLLTFQGADGGFFYQPIAGRPGLATTYNTMMGLWALVEAETVVATPAAIEARHHASDWLRRSLRNHGAGEVPAMVPGLLEQAGWVLQYTRRTVGDLQPDDARLIEAIAHDVIGRCQLDDDPQGRGCTRPLYGSGSALLYAGATPDAGHILTTWFPWAVAFAWSVVDDPTLTLPPMLREDVAALARWGFDQLVSNAGALAAEPPYRLSEYSVAFGHLR